MLVHIRPQLETAFGRVPGGGALLQKLFENVKTSLESGLHLIFVCSAVIMGVGVVVHLLLKNEPLRVRAHVVEPELAVH